jgi:hypothetical protein
VPNGRFVSHRTSYKLQASEFSLAWLTYKKAILWWTSAQETGPSHELAAPREGHRTEFTWPNTGERFLETLKGFVASVPAVASARPRPGGSMAVPIAARLTENPLITPADVAPSQPGMEVISAIKATTRVAGGSVPDTPRAHHGGSATSLLWLPPQAPAGSSGS